MASFHSLAAALLAFSAPAIAAPVAAAPGAESDRILDERAREFFDLLKAGKTLELYDVTLGRSPLMAGKEAERQALAGQIDAALRVYGPVTGFELARQTSYGSLFVKRFYVVQHEKLLTRWEINFTRLQSGWTVSYFGFEDQARTWE
jgi:hypothetical protein